MASDTFEKIDLSSEASNFSEIPMSESFDAEHGGNNMSSKDEGWDDKTESLEAKEKGHHRRGKPEKDEPDTDVTVVDLPSNAKIDPAVGWLVCIEGVDKGRSFRLVKGNNPIGRSGNLKKYAVSLTDQSISRKGACGVIVYNERSNQFFITPGELTTNINPYLNEEILLSPRKLMAKDILEIAGDVLIFVPFCSEKFKWNFADPQPQGHSHEAKNAREKYKPGAAMDEENDPNGETKMY